MRRGSATLTGALLARGKVDAQPWMGHSLYPVGPKMIGGQPKIRPGYTHFCNQKPQRPLRAIGFDTPLPPVLYNRMDQLMEIEKALVVQRTERQVSATLSQLSLGIRNAEVFLQEHLLDREIRPSLHTLWFHETEGLKRYPHVLGTLAAHHLVPLFSLISYDVEKGRMTVAEAEELYQELMDCSVAQPRIVQREIANQMVRVYCLEGEVGDAMNVIAEMERKGVRRTFVTYAPLFRHIRAQEDAEGHVALLDFMYRIEGGRPYKVLLIDVPRWLYVWGVMIRHNWAIINGVFTILGTWFTLHVLNYGFVFCRSEIMEKLEGDADASLESGGFQPRSISGSTHPQRGGTSPEATKELGQACYNAKWRPDTAVVRRLVHADANVMVRIKKWVVAYHRHIEAPLLHYLIASGAPLDVVQACLETPHPINFTARGGPSERTVLHAAVIAQSSDKQYHQLVMRLLVQRLKRHADVDEVDWGLRDRENRTVLCAAAEKCLLSSLWPEVRDMYFAAPGVLPMQLSATCIWMSDWEALTTEDRCCFLVDPHSFVSRDSEALLDLALRTPECSCSTLSSSGARVPRLDRHVSVEAADTILLGLDLFSKAHQSEG